MNGENVGCPTVKWSDIQLPTEMGGLGVGNIMYKNLTLLFKWWWRFSESDNTLWKIILQSVHDINGGKASSETFSKVRDGTWSALLSNDFVTSNVRAIVEEGMHLSVGNGSSIRFWHDKWCEAGILKRIFPRLFAISIQKNLFVCQMGEWNDISWDWNLRWRRGLYEWENDEVYRLKTLSNRNGPVEKEKMVYTESFLVTCATLERASWQKYMNLTLLL